MRPTEVLCPSHTPGAVEHAGSRAALVPCETGVDAGIRPGSGSGAVRLAPMALALAPCGRGGAADPAPRG